MRLQNLDPEGDDLTVNALAEIAEVRPRTVWKWLQGNRFPHAYRLGKSWRIPQQDVLDSVISLQSDAIASPE
jgi:predicted DNA-binding transcriptional regulator AlpA